MSSAGVSYRPRDSFVTSASLPFPYPIVLKVLYKIFTLTLHRKMTRRNLMSPVWGLQDGLSKTATWKIHMCYRTSGVQTKVFNESQTQEEISVRGLIGSGEIIRIQIFLRANVGPPMYRLLQCTQHFVKSQDLMSVCTYTAQRHVNYRNGGD